MLPGISPLPVNKPAASHFEPDGECHQGEYRRCADQRPSTELLLIQNRRLGLFAQAALPLQFVLLTTNLGRLAYVQELPNGTETG